MTSESIIYAFVLTLGAGLATGIGSAIAYFTRRTSKGFLSFSLGLSAGVMIYVSFMEIMHEATVSLSAEIGEFKGNLFAVLAFFGGIALSALIDKLVPEVENPHEIRLVEDMEQSNMKKLSRMGIFTAVAVAIHNFPEGIATFMAAVENPEVGLVIAIAIAIHNIPEGIAVSVPIYYATGSHSKAFWYSFLSGLSEPLGAVLAYLILMPFLSPILMSVVFASTAGIMVYISLDELLPAAQKYGFHHLSIYGLITGMAIMALSLIMLI